MSSSFGEKALLAVNSAELADEQRSIKAVRFDSIRLLFFVIQDIQRWSSALVLVRSVTVLKRLFFLSNSFAVVVVHSSGKANIFKLVTDSAPWRDKILSNTGSLTKLIARDIQQMWI